MRVKTGIQVCGSNTRLDSGAGMTETRRDAVAEFEALWFGGEGFSSIH
jgi:hypothetical protein